MNKTASVLWNELKSKRDKVLDRVEDYAALTIPSVYRDEDYAPEDEDGTNDYQSLGAVGVNHLVNKLALAMFAPSRPFFKLGADVKTEGDLNKLKVPPSQVVNALSAIERQAIKRMDTLAQRPMIYRMLRHVVVAGNVLLDLTDSDSMRVIGLKHFVVKRTRRGAIHTLIVCEKILFEELDDEIREVVTNKKEGDLVEYYVLCRLIPGGKYEVSQWVEDQKLPAAFSSVYAKDKLPYHVVVWDLDDAADYAKGLVEEYSRDLTALSVMSKGVTEGSIVAMEVKWLLNPNSGMRSEQLASSRNGDVLSGIDTDLSAVTAGNAQAVQSAGLHLTRVEQRVSRAFLLNSGVTRDAERVTAEEVRLQAQELETAYGGTYTTLAATVQRPIAKWLLAGLGNKTLDGLEVQIITGLEAISRNGDLENLRLALGDLAMFSTLPPDLQARIKFKELAAYVGAGRGVDMTQFLKSDEEYAADQQAMQEARVAEATATATGEAQASAQAQGPQA